MKIGIINTFTSNIQSVINALISQEYKNFKIIESYSDYDETFSHIIFPGVGTFESNMKKIIDKKINLVIKEAFKNNLFYLGICVGMQVLASSGEEGGKQDGLNIIEGSVQKLSNKNYRLPHIGWNELIIKKNDNLLGEINNNESFYFVHSYFFNAKNDKNVIATTKYENIFPSIVKINNFYGVQFHPEKSQSQGLMLIKNFLNLK
jgi:glutamine amidotransferase